MVLNGTSLLYGSHHCMLSRSVSSFISKARQNQINERNLREKRLIRKVLPNDGEDLPVNTFASTHPNPISRVFTWGMACYGALGNPNLIIPPKNKKALRTMHRPIGIPKLELKRVKDVAAGYGFTVIATDNSDKDAHFYGCGINNQGTVGNSDNFWHISKIQILYKL